MEGIITVIIASPLPYPPIGNDGRNLMSLFGKILDKLGLNKKKEAEEEQAKDLAEMARKEAEARAKLAAKPAAGAPAAKPAAMPPRPSTAPKTAAPAGPVAAAAPVAPKAISEVDVVKQLEQKAKGTGLNWKQSIVDLLTLLDIEHSREARVELAKELGAPEDVMSDSARMNTWLHKTVLKKIAENGGNIPANLLD
jgi:hypothetical protein